MENYEIIDDEGEIVIYSGTIKQGMMHGIGRLIYDNGFIKEGQIYLDDYHGYMRFCDALGQSFFV